MKNINTILTNLYESGTISLELFKTLCDNRDTLEKIVSMYNGN